MARGTYDPAKLFKDVSHVKEVSNEQYHGQSYERLSRSRLKRFMQDPRLYYELYISKEVVIDEDSAPLRYGRVYHELILEKSGLVSFENCMENTLAIFRQWKSPDRVADISNDKEEVWFVSAPEPMVIRRSSRWGDISGGRCWEFVPDDRGKHTLTGACELADMHLDGVCFTHIPKYVLNKSGGRTGDPWRYFAEDNAGKVLYQCHESAEGWGRLLSMRRRLRSHEDVHDLIYSGGEAEQTYVATCATTGLQIQFRADFLRQTPGKVLCPDLKSARWINNWEKQAIQQHLNVQAALLTGALNIFYAMPVDVVFIAQDKNPSYEPSTHIFEPGWLELGAQEYLEQATWFLTCLETGKWERKGFGKRSTIVVPEWKMKQVEDSEYASTYWGGGD